MTDYMIFNTLLVIFCPKNLEITRKSIIFAPEKRVGNGFAHNPTIFVAAKRRIYPF